ncbi:hypothetical protein ElyMa_002443200 [Elysia marginata]|uniref:ShKT domain-containing protein n=1 Tax=Elysia marginata TaxID=1093978 RepID=A0AAV4GIF0_9GAST|nr:hypothetical protein ElyMa_002443200 [Elysia marginata]
MMMLLVLLVMNYDDDDDDDDDDDGGGLGDSDKLNLFHDDDNDDFDFGGGAQNSPYCDSLKKCKNIVNFHLKKFNKSNPFPPLPSELEGLSCGKHSEYLKCWSDNFVLCPSKTIRHWSKLQRKMIQVYCTSRCNAAAAAAADDDDDDDNDDGYHDYNYYDDDGDDDDDDGYGNDGDDDDDDVTRLSIRKNSSSDDESIVQNVFNRSDCKNNTVTYVNEARPTYKPPGKTALSMWGRADTFRISSC